MKRTLSEPKSDQYLRTGGTNFSAVLFSLALFALSTQLVQLYFSVGQEFLRAGPFVLLLVAWIFSRQTRTPFQFWRVSPALLPILFLVLLSSVISFYNNGPLLPIMGILLYSSCLIAIRIFGSLSFKNQRLVLVGWVGILGANVLAQVWEVRAGVDSLLDLGIQYGQHVRQIDGVLRAPGLTLTNSEIGLAAGVSAVGFALKFYDSKINIPKPIAVIGVVVSLLAIAFSTSRSGLLIFLAGLTYIATSKQGRNGGSATLRIVLIILGAGATWFFFGVGSASTFSWDERLKVWANLIDFDAGLLFGRGLGEVGALSFSSFHVGYGVFTDNAWFNLLIQFGLFVGLAALVFTIRLFASSKYSARIHGARPLIFAVFVASFFVEIFDYALTMVLVGMFIALSEGSPSSLVRGEL